ncbi:MAG TPA: FAD-dependent oxidoreductase [Burkholderiales bacterium]|nr:FAD-dependent oxidoreductase [Burkholderiales bacterium]
MGIDRRPGFSIDTDLVVAGAGAAGVAAAVTAARCLSAQHEAVASARVTAQCFSYGHAIGHAAAMCIEAECEPRELRGADVRARVNESVKEAVL